MPSVKTQTASGRTERKCGRAGCGRVIPRGEKYYIYSFRYGGKHFRCKDHYPRRSELTQSKMSQVYSAVEGFEDDVAGNAFDTVQDVVTAVENVAAETQAVIDEYREAAEHFGGTGENAERADELESWVGELESFSPEEEDEENTFDEEQVGKELAQELFGIDAPEELTDEQKPAWLDAIDEKRQEFDDEHEESPVSKAAEEAMELMNELPI